MSREEAVLVFKTLEEPPSRLFRLKLTAKTCICSLLQGSEQWAGSMADGSARYRKHYAKLTVRYNGLRGFYRSPVSKVTKIPAGECVCVCVSATCACQLVVARALATQALRFSRVYPILPSTRPSMQAKVLSLAISFCSHADRTAPSSFTSKLPLLTCRIQGERRRRRRPRP